ncbi:MAG: DUF2062 domain-containing protein [Proteobacteria bacterium]|nr:DUF2062 domain-containing protein [Pseudomonadota bacterium]
MFKRRIQKTLGDKILGFLWPAIGWRRAWAYTMLRLARLPGSAYSIAGGFACGAAMSFTPFVGLHFILSAVLAWTLRANIIASVIGTAVGNPWTFPFIWTWLYQTGTWMVSGERLETAAKPKFSEIFGHVLQALLSWDVPYLLETATPVFWPMFVSSLPTAFVVWWVFYLPLKYTIQGYQDRRFRNRSGTAAGNEES